MAREIDRWAVYGAAAGVVGVALFTVGGLLLSDRPAFDTSGPEIAAWFDSEQTKIQVATAFFGASAPFIVWFLATVVSLTREAAPQTRRAATVAFGCGLVFLALLMADVTTTAVGALRPGNMARAPELAAALQDIELLLMGTAAPLVSGIFAAFAVIVLRDRALWPEWFGWLAIAVAVVYPLRVGTLFTTQGAFAADGVLGLWMPAVSLLIGLGLGSLVLALRVRAAAT
jgi:hypothetical protein